MDGVSVLKLDSSFKPIEVIGWEEAFVLTWLNKAWAVEYTDKWVHSAKEAFQIPSVIALKKFIDEKYFTLPCTRHNILLRDENRCQYCAKVFYEKELTIDHVIPRSKGGGSAWDNVVAACHPCNQKKSNFSLPEAPVSLIRIPRKPAYRSIIKKRIGRGNSQWQEYL